MLQILLVDVRGMLRTQVDPSWKYGRKQNMGEKLVRYEVHRCVTGPRWQVRVDKILTSGSGRKARNVNKMHKNASCERQAITTKYKTHQFLAPFFQAKGIDLFTEESGTEDKDYPSLAEVKAAFGSKDLHPSAFKPAAQD